MKKNTTSLLIPIFLLCLFSFSLIVYAEVPVEPGVAFNESRTRIVEEYSIPVFLNAQELKISLVAGITDEMLQEEIVQGRQRDTLIFMALAALSLLFSTLTLWRLNKQRKKTVRDLLEKERFQQIIADVSASLFHATADEVDEAIHQAIRQCGEFIGADRSCLVRFSEDRKMRTFEYEWCGRNVAPIMEKGALMPVNRLPWLYDCALKNQIVMVDNVAKLPPEAAEDQKVLASQQVKSLLMLPITVNRRVVASWGFEDVSGERHWEDKPLAMLQVLTKTFESAYERQAAESKLKESEERFRLLVETAPDAIFLYTERKLVYANQAAVKMLGIGSTEEIIGKPLMHWLHPDFHEEVNDRYRQLLDERKPVPLMEQIYQLPDGSQVDVEVSASPIRYENNDGALVYVRDITNRKEAERKRLEAMQQQRHQQKLESIGTLASGVAHEINNPVTGIINYAQLIIDVSSPGFQGIEYANEIILESQRISGIVKDLLFFSRQEKKAHSSASIEDIIQRTLSLVNALMRRDQIEIRLNVPENLPQLKCRSQQIQQVLMNLLTNARDALNEKYPGCHEDKVIQLSCHLFRDFGKRWIQVTVEDHGSGIPESIHERIFDPFFTTKPSELGTGLGLPISHGIITEHNGRLTFETAMGAFTRFHMVLPADNGWGLE